MILALYWVLTFGWTGSPGEWMIWAWLIKLYHVAHAPHEPRWSDVVPFHSSFLMDDQVLVEPDVGARAFQSVQVAEEGVELLL